jgi:hypothetical protein
MAQRRDILVGQKLGQLVASLHRQDGGDGVEFFGTTFNRRQGFLGHRWASKQCFWRLGGRRLSKHLAYFRLKSITSDKGYLSMVRGPTGNHTM